MIEKTIYLAGPISGLTHDEARHGWRQDFDRAMRTATDYGDDHIHCCSPMRAKEFLADIGKITGVELPIDNPLSTSAGITTRDYNDVKNCDLMVACFLEAPEGVASLGTAVEFGYAHAMQKPIIMVAKPGDMCREHPMLKRMAGYIVEDLDQAAHIAYHLLTPGL